MVFPDGSVVKNLPAMQETQVLSLGQEDSLEKGMATHSSIAWRIPWTEEPGRLQAIGSQRVGHDWVTNTMVSSEWEAGTHDGLREGHTRRNCKYDNPKVRTMLVYKGTERSVWLEHGWGWEGVIEDEVGKIGGRRIYTLISDLAYPKNWCFCAVLLEKTLESPLDCKEIQPVHPKGNQS